MADERTPDIVKQLRDSALTHWGYEAGALLPEVDTEFLFENDIRWQAADVYEETLRRLRPCMNNSLLDEHLSPLRALLERLRASHTSRDDPRACNADTSVEPSGRKIG